jgi:predicted dehydrogenase
MRVYMREQVRLVLVGVGGYGEVYVSGLLNPENSEKLKDVEIVGIVDPFSERCSRLPELQSMGIPVYKCLEEFYSSNCADLAVISSPIQFHTEQTCMALSHGSHVLCEKPLCATIQDAYKMINAERESGKWIAIGYQWSFSDAIQMLKKDINSGLLGKPLQLKTLVLWPRDEKYYKRNSWAGRKQDAKGNWVLDSPVNNATAHYLHNMFYVLGKTTSTSEYPVSIVAELYRANPIENFDTGVLRCYTDEGIEILFYSSHAVSRVAGPIFSFTFENAVVTLEDGKEVIASFSDGTTKNYGCPDSGLKKLWDAIESVKSGSPVVCGPVAASAQTLCINGMQDSVPDIVEFPLSLVRIQGEEGMRKTWVEGLDALLEECFGKSILPSEMGVPWAKEGKEVQLRDYRTYPRDF